jgi:uncharacterized protein YndB with AHSA1/START domain
MSPVVVRRERIISIPADVLWELVEPAENLPAWLPFAARCERIGGEALGRRQRMHARWGRRVAEIDQEVTAYEPGRLIRWTHVDERMNGKPALRISSEVTFTLELESIGPGTRVALESRNVPAGFAASVLLRLVAARRLGRDLDRALDNLSAVAA